MRAEILAIGDELTSGQRLDTNSQWLSQRLNEIGVPVAFHTTVGDDLESCVAAFRTAIQRADLVVSTGGLGPTADDLTRDGLAAAAGVELVENATALAHIRSLFARRRRAMPERNRLQALVPKGAQVVENPHGTAPGIDFSVARPCCAPCRVFALPGVPAEMIEMWEGSVRASITRTLPARRVICHRRIKCFGAGESDIEARLPDMIRRKREPLVGITASSATITLRITASGPNDTACQHVMQPTIQQIHEALGTLVFGEEDDELEHAVVRLLGKRHQTLAVAEAGTGGLLSHWLTRVDTSDVFRGGVAGASGGQLLRLLGVAPASAAGTPAKALAEAARQGCDANFGLSAVADEELHIALATPAETLTKRFPLLTHPDIVQTWAAKQALNTLRLRLIDRSS